MRYVFALAIVVVAALVACSGGGNGSLPTSGASSGQTAGKNTASATFAIFIPSASAMKKARPQYVSPNTQYAAITLTEESGSPVPSPTPLVINLTPGSPNCTSSPGGTTCSVTSTYLVGMDAWTIALYGSGGVSSTPLSINSVAQNVVAGANTVDLTMNPVVASLAFTPGNGSCMSSSTSCTQSLVLEALDATGAVIVGPGSFVNASQNAVGITIAAPPSGVTLETSSGSGAAMSATGPAQMNLAQIAYSGGSSASTLSVNASDTNGDNASYTLNLTAPPAVPSWNGQDVNTETAPPPINGTPNAFTPPIGDTSTGGQGPLNSTFDNGNESCLASMSNNYHIHIFLGIYVNGSWLAVPKAIGIVDPNNSDYVQYGTCFYFTHTHDSTDIVHVEYTNPDNVPVTQPVFMTGDIFNTWGITVNAGQFGPFTGPVTVYTSGQVYRGGGDCSGTFPPAGTVTGNGYTDEQDLTLWTGDPDQIPLYSHEVIWYIVGSPAPASLPSIDFDEEC